MKNTATIQFVDRKNRRQTELEVPLNISANDLIIALNNAYTLGMKVDKIFECYLVAENPIAFLKGNKTLQDFGIRNGSVVIYNGEE